MSLTIRNGQQLRSVRKNLSISQARLAEITKIAQGLISAYELGKRDLTHFQLETIEGSISNIKSLKEITHRTKRYRQHTYSGAVNKSRAAQCERTTGNVSYLRELQDLSSQPKAVFSGISLFAGIGGISKGFKRAGCNIRAFIEIDDELAKTYESNFPGTYRLGKDIASVTTQDIKAFLDGVEPIDCVIGGPPCQGFSLAGKRDVKDPRNYLFREYLRVLEVVAPKVAVFENVRLLTSMKSKTGLLMKDEILAGFESLGYQANMYVVNAMAYGIPQHRERVFFVAIRHDLNMTPSFPEPTFSNSLGLFRNTKQVRTFADACSDLPYLESGEESEDPYHRSVAHPDHVIRWLWDVKQGASAHENSDPTLRPPSGYNTTYKRQLWLEPGSTVQTTFGMISGCRNVHPIATRALTIREAARLQSFPDDFRYLGTLGKIRTGIGNAVPPLLARQVGEHLASSIF